MKKKFRISGLVLCIVLFISSCNTLDPIPTDNYTDATFWQTTENAELVVNMAYNQMYSADKMWNDEALSDNVFEGRTNTDARAIRIGIADPTLGRFASEWSQAYGGLKTCHIFMENVDRVPNVSEAWKQRRIAEIRFVRAYIYFRLVNFYGDVPFFTKDVTLDESAALPRTAKATVLAFIHNELDEIADVLPSKNELPSTDNGRITKGAAVALQARAYLYEGNWVKVVDYTDRLINQQGTYGNYGLFSSYKGLFEAANEYNEEVILDYSYVPSLKMWGKLYDAAPLSAGARLNAYAPLQSLVDSYWTNTGQFISQNPNYSEDNPYVNRDPRLDATVVYHGSQWTDFDGQTRTIYTKPGTGSNSQERMDVYSGPSANASPTGYYIKKYYDRTATQTFDAGLNIIMIRYADILLMHAEAKHELGQFDATLWNQTIRPIRERAGLTASSALNYPSTINSTEMKELIRNERRIELALEGLRYYDIIRWKAGKTYLDGTIFGAKFADGNTSYIRLDTRRFDENRDYLWSLPQSQMDLNKNLLPNNPGHAN